MAEIYGLSDSDRRKLSAMLGRDRHAARRVNGTATPAELFEEYPREIEWYNLSADDCPPGGVIKITDYEADTVDPSWRLHGTKPDGSRGHFYAINGSSTVSPSYIGRCLLYGQAMARIPDGTTQGDKLYAQSGSWDAATSGKYQIGRVLGPTATLQVNDSGTSAGLKPILLETDEPIYWLKRCHEAGLSAGEAAAYQVANDLENAVDKIVKLDDGHCYTVYENNPDGTGTTLENVNRCPARCVVIIKIFDDCETCLACWKLHRCGTGTPGTVKYTRTDLSDYEGDVVKLLGEEEYCWEVSMAATGECESPEAVTVIQNYNDCDYCGTCYNVENCHDAGDDRVVSLDLGALFPGDADAAAIIAAERVVRIDGRCYRIESEAEDCSAAEYPDSPRAYANCSDCPCYVLTECPGGADGTKQVHAATGPDGPLDLGDYLTKTVRLDDGLCYTVADGGDCEDSEAVTVLESYDDCEECLCYTLHLCGSGSPGTTKSTYSDLSNYFVADENRVVREEGGDCWEIISNTAAFAGTVPFVVAGSSTHCENCDATQKYKLTNDCENEACEGADPAPVIVTTEDLDAAIGRWVKVGGICYKVTAYAGGDAVTDATVEYQGPYNSCALCQSSPITTTKRVMINMVVGEDGASWVQAFEKWTFTNGVLTGVCRDDDVTIDGCEDA